MPTIVQEIEGVESCILRCETRLDDIERSLRLSELCDQEIEDLKLEEKLLQKKLGGHQKNLKSLRKENFKTTFISALILVGAFGAYMIFWT